VTQFLLQTATFLCGEILAMPVFRYVRKRFGPPPPHGVLSPDGQPAARSSYPLVAIGKGTLERLMLFTGLASGVPTVLIVFGALKVATRLKTEAENNVSNDYFLIGNLLSIIIVLAENAVWPLFRP
jgi:hypothetical protein